MDEGLHQPPIGSQDASSEEDAAVEAYLRALAEGRAEALETFCARFGEVAPAIRARLEPIATYSGGRSAAAQDDRSDLPFERLGEFRLLGRLGGGGMGLVFLAEQEPLRRRVALKVLRGERAGSPEDEGRFHREVQAVGRLRHPNIVTVFASGEDQGVRWLAMEVVDGPGLDEVIRDAWTRGERIAGARVATWGAALARALQHAHAVGVIHRDVKPSNVRIARDGRPVLVDFGLARDVLAADLTLTGDFRGTPHYASPEQISARRGRIDARTDVYSLGATLYE